MDNKPNTNQWLSLITIPSQMGITIYLFFLFGSWLDHNHPNSYLYYHKILTLIGVIVSLYNVIKQVNQISK